MLKRLWCSTAAMMWCCIAAPHTHAPHKVLGHLSRHQSVGLSRFTRRHTLRYTDTPNDSNLLRDDDNGDHDDAGVMMIDSVVNTV